MSSVLPASSAPLQAPGLGLRFSSLVYEVLVLFGVSLINGAIGALLQAITGDNQDTLSRFIAFGVFGLYFTWFWTRQGQTLPMQTWNIRVVTAQGEPLSIGRAVARFFAACLWVAPPALLMWVAHWARPGAKTAAAAAAPPGDLLTWVAGWSSWTGLLAVGIWGALYGLSALLQPQRQFWHDILVGTRLVRTPPRVRAPR
ncbi:MAG: hypothetical protein RLZZ618_3718 [Pseudomonadota bacterium]|jgi:uncharacterized RDD family membrane protein YckC